MCGLMGLITGATNGFTKNDIDTMTGLLFMTQLRGTDSTGVCAVSNLNESSWYKALGTPDKLFESKDWPTFHGELWTDGRGMFGHCRAATRGTVNIDNAHPFEVKRADGTTVTLVHNGTLSEVQTLTGKDSHDVDSKWLAEMIAEHGADKALGLINGPIATIWHDSADGTINWYRNYERPLFMAKSRDNRIYLQSEKETMIWARMKFTLLFDEADIFEIATHQHYSFDIEKGGDVKVTPLPKKYPQYDPDEYKYYRDYQRPKPIEAEYTNTTPVPYIPPTKPTVGAVVVPKMPETRGLTEDIEHLLNMRLDHVTFIDAQRISRIGYSSVWTIMSPYEPGLRSLYRLDPDKVQVLWTDGRTAVYTKKDIPSTNVVPIAKILETPPLSVKLKLRKNAKLKWATTHGKLSINHWAKCGDNILHHFAAYKNSNDGEIRLGDVVKFEASDFVERGPNHTEVFGFRLKADQDYLIGCQFTDIHHTAEYLRERLFYEGVVRRIRLATKQEYTISGNMIELELDNVLPLTHDEADKLYAKTH
jgi:Glutamine amidotransferase domain